MATPLLRPLTMGEVLDTAFGLYRNQFAVLVTIAALMQAVPGVLGVYLEVSGKGLENFTLTFFHLFVSFLFGSVAVAASTFVISGAYLGQQVRASDASIRALGLLMPLLVISLLSTLMIFFGFLLLIIPGFIVIAGLSLSNATLVLESPIGPTEAMRRSWFLTTGHRAKVLVTLLVAGLLLVVPMVLVGVVSAIGASLGAWPLWLGPVMALGFSIFVYPFVYVVVVVLYYDMRVRKEGFDLELLARASGTA